MTRSQNRPDQLGSEKLDAVKLDAEPFDDGVQLDGGEPHLTGAETSLAVADLVRGELGRAEERCTIVLDRTEGDTASFERRLAHGIVAVVAYLCGDFASTIRFGRAALETPGSHEQDDPALLEPAVPAVAVPAMVLAHHGIGADDSARALLADYPLPTANRAALRSLLVHDERTSQPTLVAATQQPGPPSDLAIGAAAAAILHVERDIDSVGAGRADGFRDSAGSADAASVDAVLFDTVRAGVAGGHRTSLAVPVSVERALATGLALGRELERAAAVLDVAERRWRAQQAYTELAEVLISQAKVGVALGQRRDAADRVAEAHDLADRLGLRSVKAKALRLSHPNPDGADLGRPDDRLVLVSDVVGSTRVGTTVGDEAYFELIMVHHELVRPLFERHGGVEFSEGGDSLLAWFESPEDALDCALEILDAAATSRRAGSELRVRVSVAGQLFFGNGRPYGTAVNLAHRLLPNCEPGQIVVDEVTLTRLSRSVVDFTSRSIELDDFGINAIGLLPSEPVV